MNRFYESHPFNKIANETIRSNDWNDIGKKLDELNDLVTGTLTIEGTNPGLTIRRTDNNQLSQLLFKNSDDNYIANIHTTGIPDGDLVIRVGPKNDNPQSLPERLTITNSGNIGVGIADPQYKLDVLGEITSRNSTAFRLRQTNYGLLFCNNDQKSSLLLTNNGDPDGNHNTLRPFSIDNSSGNVSIGDGALNIRHGGNVSMEGNLNVSGKVQTPRLTIEGANIISNGKYDYDTAPENCFNISLDNVRIFSIPNPYLFRVGHNWSNIITLPNNPPIFQLGFVNKFSIDEAGNLKAAGTITPNSADYSELFESENGKEIPIGTAVIIGEAGLIRPVKKGEIPIGVITKTPGMLANNPSEWPGKYKCDDYGNKIMETFEEEVPISEAAVEELNTLVKDGRKLSAKDKKRLLRKAKGVRPKLNPEYDPKQLYVERTQRAEWQAVGLLGLLHMTKGQPVSPTWVKVRDVSDKVELWLIK